MRTSALLVALLMLPLLPGTAVADGESMLVATGETSHTIEYRQGGPFALAYRAVSGAPACEGEGAMSLVVDFDEGRATLLTADDGCPAGFSSVSGCARTADHDVACDVVNGNVRITLRLAYDGAFSFVWDEPAFREVIQGRLEQRG